MGFVEARPIDVETSSLVISSVVPMTDYITVLHSEGAKLFDFAYYYKGYCNYYTITTCSYLFE